MPIQIVILEYVRKEMPFQYFPTFMTHSIQHVYKYIFIKSFKMFAINFHVNYRILQT